MNPSNGISLFDLRAIFIRRDVRSEDLERSIDNGTPPKPSVYTIPVHSLTDAQGVRFLCPKCYAAHGGAIGTHSIICWSRSRGIPNDADPGPGRWKMDGTGLDDLTLNADAPSSARSIQLNGGCAWHGYVTQGRATDA